MFGCVGVQVNIMYVRVRHNFKNHNMHACTILDTSSDILISPFNLYDIVCVFARMCVLVAVSACARARVCVCVSVCICVRARACAWACLCGTCVCLHAFICVFGLCPHVGLSDSY